MCLGGWNTGKYLQETTLCIGYILLIYNTDDNTLLMQLYLAKTLSLHLKMILGMAQQFLLY